MEELEGEATGVEVMRAAARLSSILRGIISVAVGTFQEEVQDAAERAGVEIRVEEPFDDSSVDAVRMEVALMNLMTNAIKFSDPETEEGWVRLSTGPARHEGLDGGRRITVEDNGRGIPPEVQNRFFQRFFRAHPEVEGTGVGLEIAKRMVEQRGGRLSFESEPGEGTVFHIETSQRLDLGERNPGDVAP